MKSPRPCFECVYYLKYSGPSCTFLSRPLEPVIEATQRGQSIFEVVIIKLLLFALQCYLIFFKCRYQIIVFHFLRWRICKNSNAISKCFNPIVYYIVVLLRRKKAFSSWTNVILFIAFLGTPFSNLEHSTNWDKITSDGALQFPWTFMFKRYFFSNFYPNK